MKGPLASERLPIVPSLASHSWPCDTALFLATYLPGVTLPLALENGWSLVSVQSDRVNRALELVAGRDTVTFKIIVEPRSTMRCLAHTTHLNMTHGILPPGLSGHREVGGIVRALAVRFRAVEVGLEADVVDDIFRGPEQRSIGHFRELQLRINRDCNEQCVFCNTPVDAERILGSRQEVMDSIRREFVRGYRRLTLTGREPTLDPHLIDYVALASTLGYELVRIQTNATTLSKRSYLEALVGAGLNGVHISMHTFRHDTFEALVGPGRLLDKTIEGIENVASFPGLQCNLLYVITRENYTQMEEFVREVARRFGRRVEFVLFSPMAPMGDGARNVQFLPPLGELRDQLRAAFEAARQTNVVARVPLRCGLPLCLTPPEHYELNDELRSPPGDNLEMGKSKPPQCASCRFTERCGGVWTRYLEIHGSAEIVPVV